MGNKLWLAFIGAFFTMFVLGYLFYGVLATGFVEKTYSNVAKPGGENLLGITIAYIIIAFMMAWMYPKGYAGGSPIGEGLRFGLAVGVLIYISGAFVQNAVMPVPLGSVLGIGIWGLVEAGAGGIVIGKIYGQPEEAVTVEAQPETPAPPTTEEATPPETEPAEETA